MPTHLLGNFARGGARTLCGRLQRRGVELSRSGEPTCPECKRIDEADAAAMGFTLSNGLLISNDTSSTKGTR